ncbi:hypothetical protein E1B28_012696 [Marasmius oreades]|uniref:Uncharacterized protein n=1 Tax=Marasmius oreades TaxID=181124 RepID=A0A9P7UNY9_9AGAR|nr:uncharacterized protein E1B28_012696 [Marasmius oreades]KAG7088728.1 hypothetical protein E1B28_012696 [Marasmius oreades]
MAKKPTLHVLADDLESFFHVLSLQILEYTQHSMTSSHLANHIQKVYEEVEEVEVGVDSHHPPEGGKSKSWALIVQSMRLLAVPNKVLHTFLADLEEVLRVRYEIEPVVEVKIDLNDIRRLEQELANTEGEGWKILRQAYAAWQYTKHTKYLEDHNWILDRFNRAANLEHEMPEKLKLNKTRKHLVEDLYEARTRKRKNDAFYDSEDARWGERHWYEKEVSEDEVSMWE